MSCRTRWTIVARSEQQRRGHVGDIADKNTMLEVACSRCDRHGRLSVAKLIERHGAKAQLTTLRMVIPGDCPWVGGVICEQCGVLYPQFVRLWRGEPPVWLELGRVPRICSRP